MQESDLDLITNAALSAGEIAMGYFRRDLKAWDKGGGQGPVSEADIAIDQMLMQCFLTARADYGWLSEETEDKLERLDREMVFIIDPIDGTRSFINGHVNFAHSIAIAKNGVVVAGVVHLPAKNLTYKALRGKGAWLNDKPLKHSGETLLRGARILASGSQIKSDLWYKDPPPIERHFRSSLAYRMCLVAQGRFDGMLSLRPTWEWDVAAGDLICKEAGVMVTTRLGKTTEYNGETASLDGMIATAPGIHKELLGYLE